ncbi:hypothetical protein CCP4SC76_190013 [Gammaproteobacteria bacterium]
MGLERLATMERSCPLLLSCKRAWPVAPLTDYSLSDKYFPFSSIKILINQCNAWNLYFWKSILTVRLF